MDNSFKEYIKIEGADQIVSNISKTSSEFDGAIDKTQLLAEYKNEKYHEIAKANALSRALLSDIQILNSFFMKKELTEKPELKRGRGRPRKTNRETKAEKMMKMKANLNMLKESLRRR